MMGARSVVVREERCQLMVEVGDRIRLSSMKGQAREGLVTVVTGSLVRVRWVSGEETMVAPAPGTLSVLRAGPSLARGPRRARPRRRPARRRRTPPVRACRRRRAGRGRPRGRSVRGADRRGSCPAGCWSFAAPASPISDLGGCRAAASTGRSVGSSAASHPMSRGRMRGPKRPVTRALVILGWESWNRPGCRAPRRSCAPG